MHRTYVAYNGRPFEVKGGKCLLACPRNIQIHHMTIFTNREAEIIATELSCWTNPLDPNQLESANGSSAINMMTNELHELIIP